MTEIARGKSICMVALFLHTPGATVQMKKWHFGSFLAAYFANFLAIIKLFIGFKTGASSSNHGLRLCQFPHFYFFGFRACVWRRMCSFVAFFVILLPHATFVPNFILLGILRPQILFGEQSPTQTARHPAYFAIHKVK